MPRVAVLLTSFLTGGMERQALSLASAAREHGFESLVVSMSGSGPLQRDIQEAGLQSLVMDKKSGLDLPFFYKLARMYKSESIDLVHAHNWFAGFYAVGGKLFSHTPVVTTLHGNAYRVAGRRLILRRLAAKYSNYTVCVGKMIREKAIRDYHLDPSKVRVVYNGVDCEAFASSSRRDPVRADLDIGPETTVFLFVGRISPIKDLPCLLQAAALLAPGQEDFRVVIAGGGESLEELKQEAARLGVADRVLFLGERRDIAGLMAASDALVMSSLNEGISMAILEAMASGLPVIATEVGGNAELVRNNETGFLVRSQDPAALAETMMRVINDPKQSGRMGRLGREVCVAEFSLQQMVGKYCAVYDDALSGE